MRHHIVSILVLLLLTTVAKAQHFSDETAKGEFRGLNHQELIERIFVAEKRTIAQFSKYEPIVETYAQSLDPDSSSEAPIDDVYFLGKVSLDVDSAQPAPLQRFAFGKTESSRRIRLNTGDQWPLHPDAEVDMLFVDLFDFDAHHYRLALDKVVTLGNTECLQISVSPIEVSSAARFVGQVWVETTGFHIVRIQGTFTPRQPNSFVRRFNPGGVSSVGIYFHFDSYRQEISQDVWMPSHTYFDEGRTWNAERIHFTTSFRFRGITSVWGYQKDPSMEESTVPLGDPIGQLQSAGLIGSSGEVEQQLNRILQDIQTANSLPAPALNCRVLLTTPVEIFGVGRTVMVSRGLLNVVPDRVSLAFLMAREVAHVILGHSHTGIDPGSLIFDARRKGDFPGFGIAYTPTEEEAATRKAMELLQGTEYAQPLTPANQFLSLLALHHRQVPHLLRLGFGTGPLKIVTELSASREALSPGTLQSQPSLRLGGDYTVDSWENRIVFSGDRRIAGE